MYEKLPTQWKFLQNNKKLSEKLLPPSQNKNFSLYNFLSSTGFSVIFHSVMIYTAFSSTTFTILTKTRAFFICRWYILNLLSRRSDINIRYNLYSIPQYHTKKFEGSFSYRASHLLNDVYNDLDLLLITFINEIKENLLI